MKIPDRDEPEMGVLKIPVLQVQQMIKHGRSTTAQERRGLAMKKKWLWNSAAEAGEAATDFDYEWKLPTEGDDD
jgi:hypothetical protein